MVQSVDRALTIIKIVSSRKEGIGVTELANKLGLNKSSIFRILETLTAHGFVEQNKETKKYKLGYQVLELSTKLLESIDIRKEAIPFLRELEEISNEVIHLVTYFQKEAVYIEKLEGHETLRMHSQVGRRAPMHCTSAGKVILANLPKNEAIEIIQQTGLPRHTDKTITTEKELLENLVMIKEQGYGIEREENETGITCIAAPIFNHRGEIAGAISISGTALRMNDDKIAAIKDKLIEVGTRVSQRLGYASKDL
ncbi:IclR family transcriptional regulator [Bacillus sp. EB600]|uniref:IclR family transcriptional regulator n=1 Tax=Bacillus sp. EB600 TaxID=2806345 RepID=UPI00210C4CC0|nr:IclR family transcriptional regulator [Bacillus sp. EB600]MCQ6280115.1 IclR family transcriptional regulator [Bacillus sp. EB600]